MSHSNGSSCTDGAQCLDDWKKKPISASAVAPQVKFASDGDTIPHAFQGDFRISEVVQNPYAGYPVEVSERRVKVICGTPFHPRVWTPRKVFASGRKAGVVNVHCDDFFGAGHGQPIGVPTHSAANIQDSLSSERFQRTRAQPALQLVA
jgi:hypothetical protein